MHNSLRNISLFCLLLSIFHAVGTGLLFFFIASENLGFTFEFSIIVYLISGTLILLLVSIALRSLAQDLELQEDFTMSEIAQLKKTVESLEKRGY